MGIFRCGAVELVLLFSTFYNCLLLTLFVCLFVCDFGDLEGKKSRRKL